MLSMKIFQNQRGDTIAEVLICAAIIGLMLSAAFVVSNRNTTANRMSQERATALKISESQIEMLKAYADVSAIPQDKFFCFKQVNVDSANPSGIQLIQLTGSEPDINKDSDNGQYPNDCLLEEAGGIENLYQVIFWPPNKSPSIGAEDGVAAHVNIAYGLTIRWDAANGGDREEQKSFYRFYSSPGP